MTETQYLLGWLAYLAGGTGCMLGLWLLVRNWNTRIKRALMAFFAIIVYMPGITQSDMSFWSPAFLTSIYDILTYGPEAAMRNGQVVMLTAVVAVLVALVLPVSKPAKASDRKQAGKAPSESNHSHQGRQRKEPTY